MYRYSVIALQVVMSYIYLYLAGTREEVTTKYWIVEIIFGIDLIINFFVDFKDPTSLVVVRNFDKSSDRYLHGDFPYDLIPLVPL